MEAPKDFTVEEAVLAMVGSAIAELARRGVIDETSVEVIFHRALERTSLNPASNLHLKLLELEAKAGDLAAAADRARAEAREQEEDDERDG